LTDAAALKLPLWAPGEELAWGVTGEEGVAAAGAHRWDASVAAAADGDVDEVVAAAAAVVVVAVW